MRWLRPIDFWFMDQVFPHERHYLRLARRWSRTADEARDLVQEAYLKMLRLEDWASLRDPRAYAITTIRSLVLQRVRRSQVVSIAEIPSQELVDLRDERPGIFEIVANREALANLLADVERLPPTCRQVIRLRKFEDVPAREIALRLGVAVSTVETHLARGMQQLLKMRQARAAHDSSGMRGDVDENEKLASRR